MTRLSSILYTALLAAGIAGGPAGAAGTIGGTKGFAPPTAPAQLQAETRARHSETRSLDLSGIKWTCLATSCKSAGPLKKSALEACKELSAKVGKVLAFNSGPTKLQDDELAKCNEAATAAAPADGKAKQQAAKPAEPSIAKPSARAGQPSATPGQAPIPPDRMSTTAGAFAPVRLRTGQATLVGTGTLNAASPAFAQRSVRTPPLSLTGTGTLNATSAGFTPRTVRTEPLSMTGTGSL